MGGGAILFTCFINLFWDLLHRAGEESSLQCWNQPFLEIRLLYLSTKAWLPLTTWLLHNMLGSRTFLSPGMCVFWDFWREKCSGDGTWGLTLLGATYGLLKPVLKQCALTEDNPVPSSPNSKQSVWKLLLPLACLCTLAGKSNWNQPVNPKCFDSL